MSEMDRLTTYNDDGEAQVLDIGHKVAFAKLAAYEDTKLTPEEILQLRAENAKLREETQTLVSCRDHWKNSYKIMAELIQELRKDVGSSYYYDGKGKFPEIPFTFAEKYMKLLLESGQDGKTPTTIQGSHG